MKLDLSPYRLEILFAYGSTFILLTVIILASWIAYRKVATKVQKFE